MASILNEKYRFLTVYDYGMGGIWFVVLARTKEEVLEKYPFLQFPDTRNLENSTGVLVDEIQPEFIQDADLPDIEMMAAARDESSFKL